MFLNKGGFWRLYRKAERLINEGRVIEISPIMYYVIGDHGKYFVRIQNGRVKCMCDGYRKRKYCSHVLSVLLLMLREDYKYRMEAAIRNRLEKQFREIVKGNYLR